MTSPAAPIAATIAGVFLALFAVIGGVAAVAPTANGPDKSEQVVLYDAP